MRAARFSYAAHPGCQPSGLDGKRAPASVLRIAVERSMGDRNHLHTRLGARAVSGRGPGFFPTQVVGCSFRPTTHRKFFRRIPYAIEVHATLDPFRRSSQHSRCGSDAWRRCCKGNDFAPSINRYGNCWNNAVVEPFLGCLNKERIDRHIYTGRTVASSHLYGYINRFQKSHAATDLAVSVRTSSRQGIGSAGQASTKSEELHPPSKRLQLHRPVLADFAYCFAGFVDPSERTMNKKAATLTIKTHRLCDFHHAGVLVQAGEAEGRGIS